MNFLPNDHRWKGPQAYTQPAAWLWKCGVSFGEHCRLLLTDEQYPSDRKQFRLGSQTSSNTIYSSQLCSAYYRASRSWRMHCPTRIPVITCIHLNSRSAVVINVNHLYRVTGWQCRRDDPAPTCDCVQPSLVTCWPSDPTPTTGTIWYEWLNGGLMRTNTAVRTKRTQWPLARRSYYRYSRS